MVGEEGGLYTWPLGKFGTAMEPDLLAAKQGWCRRGCRRPLHLPSPSALCFNVRRCIGKWKVLRALTLATLHTTCGTCCCCAALSCPGISEAKVKTGAKLVVVKKETKRLRGWALLSATKMTQSMTQKVSKDGEGVKAKPAPAVRTKTSRSATHKNLMLAPH